MHVWVHTAGQGLGMGGGAGCPAAPGSPGGPVMAEGTTSVSS